MLFCFLRHLPLAIYAIACGELRTLLLVGSEDVQQHFGNGSSYAISFIGTNLRGVASQPEFGSIVEQSELLGSIIIFPRARSHQSGHIGLRGIPHVPFGRIGIFSVSSCAQTDFCVSLQNSYLGYGAELRGDADREQRGGGK